MGESVIVAMADLASGEEGDFFALIAEKQTLLTKDGKPYYRVTFRDARRDCSFPIWSDAPLADACRDEWTVGEFYKLRALYRETNYGPQLEIRKIRAVEPSDEADGFSPGLAGMTYLAGATATGLPSWTDIEASLAADSPTVIINAETGERVPHWAEIDASFAGKTQNALLVRPAVRLDDNTRYIVAIRNVVNESGEVIGMPRDCFPRNAVSARRS